MVKISKYDKKQYEINQDRNKRRHAHTHTHTQYLSTPMDDRMTNATVE